MMGFRYIDEKGEQLFIIADKIEVSATGALLFFDKNKSVIRAVAAGSWREVWEDFE